MCLVVRECVLFEWFQSPLSPTSATFSQSPFAPPGLAFDKYIEPALPFFVSLLFLFRFLLLLLRVTRTTGQREKAREESEEGARGWVCCVECCNNLTIILANGRSTRPVLKLSLGLGRSRSRSRRRGRSRRCPARACYAGGRGQHSTDVPGHACSGLS